MASTTQDTLYDAFSNAAGSQAVDLEPIANASDELADSLQGVTGQMSEGPSQSSSGTSSNAPQSAASEALSIATTVLESGLGLIPLVTGLIGLFTGGDSTPAPLTKYVMPDKIDFEGADTGSGTSEMDYDQLGTPRTYDGPLDSPSPLAAETSAATPAGGSQTSGGAPTVDFDQMGTLKTYDGSLDSSSSLEAETSPAAAPGPGAATPAAASGTTGNALTIDSQWFMDHSSDIARAVRNAMLNMSSINDVMSDL